jgi:hypothetical protein
MATTHIPKCTQKTEIIGAHQAKEAFKKGMKSDINLEGIAFGSTFLCSG